VFQEFRGKLACVFMSALVQEIHGDQVHIVYFIFSYFQIVNENCSTQYRFSGFTFFLKKKTYIFHYWDEYV
jgi:hypothetical protein